MTKTNAAAVRQQLFQPGCSQQPGSFLLVTSGWCGGTQLDVAKVVKTFGNTKNLAEFRYDSYCSNDPSRDRSEMEKAIQTRRWLERLARMGYATRGVVYLVVGLFAFFAAVLNHWRIVGSKGAIVFVQHLSLGTILLMALIVGLVGYSTWRFLQAVLDVDRQGRKFMGLAIRGALLVSAMIHSSLALYAISLLLGATGGEGKSREFTAWLMSSPPGQWALMLAGAGIIAGGAAQCYKGLSKRFNRYLEFGQADSRKAELVCAVGLVGRGLVFALTGVMFLVAVARQESEDAAGLGETLQTLREQTYGRWLLGLAAISLLAFSAYSFLEARYRRIPMGKVKLPG